ncbi:MAG: glycosyltransferase family 4 protein [Clostridia bacterium]|nr:glycosyltransferase family 4 protein [Clostridia bacterium]
MKILVVCQHYYPEPFRITDICEEFVKRGHEVTVITGTPNYPEGVTYKGYEKGKKKREIINGVEVLRAYEIPRKKGILYRFLNYYSFAISSKKLAKKLKGDYDVIFANQLSPIMMVDGAIAYKKKNKTKLVMYVMDLWPASLKAGGVKESSLLYKYYKGVSKRRYTKADVIAVTSKSFIPYLKENFKISDDKFIYIPQYAESLFSVEACKKQPNEYIDLMFAGNIGKAQTVETIIKSANEVKENKNIRFHIVGDGVSLENCKKLSESYKLENVTFYGRRPVEEMPNFYKMADAMLVTLTSDEFSKLTLPGKVQSYMASGKPIIASIDGEGQEIIKEANVGYVSNAEDYKSLAENIKAFSLLSKEEIKILGENSYNYCKENFSKDSFIENLERLFN